MKQDSSLAERLNATMDSTRGKGAKKCELCGLVVEEIPRFKRGECPGQLQHQFVPEQTTDNAAQN